MLLPGQVSLVKQVLISRWGAKMNLNVVTQSYLAKHISLTMWICFFLFLLGVAAVSNLLLSFYSFLWIRSLCSSCIFSCACFLSEYPMKWAKKKFIVWRSSCTKWALQIPFCCQVQGKFDFFFIRALSSGQTWLPFFLPSWNEKDLEMDLN